MDTSGSISRRNFQHLLGFIRSIVDGFEVSEDHTHIAIVEYSTKASVQLKFNDLTGSELNKPNVRNKVRAIPHKRGYTYIDKALRLANDEVFTLRAGMRDDVRKVRRRQQNSLSFRLLKARSRRASELQLAARNDFWEKWESSPDRAYA